MYVQILKKDNKILKYNHGEKSMKVPFIIYADSESLLEKLNTCHDNPKKLLTTKINKNAASDYSLFTNISLDTTKNKFNYYIVNGMKRLFKDLKEHATKTINY